jgi:hypothetical protein
VARRHLPPTLNEEAAADLREALARADFTVEALETALGIQELSGTRSELAVHVRRLGVRDRFSALVKLFVLGVGVEPGEVRAALEPLRVETAAELGLVVTTGSGNVCATVRLVPHGDYYVASDLPHDPAGDTPFDHVPGIQAPSVTLAKLAVRRPVASAFDLGTGCGIQALLAARHAERVVAGDVSSRALSFAAFNTFLSEDALTHAASWLRPLGDTPGFEAALDRWLAYLREEGIEAIGYGAVVLRRRAGGGNWVRADEIPLDRLEPAGEHVLRVFSTQDQLADIADDRALLGERVALVVAHRVEQTLHGEDGGFVVLHQTLALTEGLAFRAEIDRYTVSLLPGLDGVRPVGEVVERVARELEIDDAERDEFVLGALPVVRRLLELGFAELLR